MSASKFQPSEWVEIDGRSGHMDSGLFEVVRVMPDEGRGHEYRLRSESGRERISFEHVMRRAVPPHAEEEKRARAARTPTRGRGK